MAIASKFHNPSATTIQWHADQPMNPMIGDCYFDHITYCGYIWQGSAWVKFNGTPLWVPPVSAPTAEQLEKHPALKEVWEEFLVIKKLLGV